MLHEWGPVSGITHAQGALALATYGYTYNAAGLVSSFSSDANTAGYSYDATGQLVGVDNSTLPDEGHTYDANGNRTGAGYAVGAGTANSAIRGTPTPTTTTISSSGASRTLLKGGG